MADGMAKNWQVIQRQWEEYRRHCRDTITPELKAADGIGRKAHKFHAYVEEFFDYNPRILSYLLYPALLAVGAHLWAVWS